MIDHHVLVRIGQTDINVGDLILADSDGIIAIPHEIVREVLEKAEDTAARKTSCAN